MSDYERYSDSDHRDNDDEKLYPVPLWIRVTKLLAKIMLVTVCLATVGLLVFRMIFASYYPAVAKQLYMTDALRAAYVENGQLDAYTQNLLIPYESRKDGFFFADNLIFLYAPGSLQCSLRVNRKTYEDIAEANSVDLPSEIEGFLSFSLYYGGEEVEDVCYTPTHVERTTRLYYDYYKICFDGVDFADIPWFRLNIHIAGHTDTEADPAACIVVYENNEEYSAVTPYAISGEEYAGE